MNEKELLKLKEEYGYVPSSYKYVPMANEIMKCIGQNVVLVTYTKEEDPKVEDEGEKDPNDVGRWSTSTSIVHIRSIRDYDPMTMTHLIEYSETDVDGKVKEEVLSMRLQPEGYEFVNAEETGLFRRFQPFHLHHKMMEDEFFFFRLRSLYATRETLPFEALETISGSKNQGQILRYSNNIGAAVKILEDGSLIWIRIHSLRVKHRKNTTYGLFFSSDGKEWSTMIDREDKVYKLGDWAEFKIVDLADMPKPTQTKEEVEEKPNE